MEDPPHPRPVPSVRESWIATIRKSLRGVQYDYTQGSVSRGILMLAIPMMLEMGMESLFAVVDVYFVARLGKAAVAAVGLTESVLSILYAVAIGLGMSVTALVARRVGEGNPRAAGVAAVQAIALGLALSLVIGLAGGFGARRLLEIMGASSEVQTIGTGYTTVVFASNAVILLLFLLNAVFRGAGDPAIAMRSLWLANGINLVLDPCFIFGYGPFPELGLTGAAVATSIGRGAGVIYQLWCLGRGTGRIHLDRGILRLNPTAMWSLLRMSLGGIGQYLIGTASWVILIRLLSPFGDTAVAGYTVAIRILVFTFLPAWGLSNAAATLAGQNLGARQPERAERSVWLTGVYTMTFLGLVSLIMILFPRPLVALFTKDLEVIGVGANCLRIISLGYVFYAWGMTITQAFNGSGDTTTPTWINLVAFWMLEIPLAWILARGVHLGPNGVFWAIPIAESTLALIAVAVFRRGKWKLREV